jgi:hypothetical protein
MTWAFRGDSVEASPPPRTRDAAAPAAVFCARIARDAHHHGFDGWRQLGKPRRRERQAVRRQPWRDPIQVRPFRRMHARYYSRSRSAMRHEPSAVIQPPFSRAQVQLALSRVRKHLMKPALRQRGGARAESPSLLGRKMGVLARSSEQGKSSLVGDKVTPFSLGLRVLTWMVSRRIRG